MKVSTVKNCWEPRLHGEIHSLMPKERDFLIDMVRVSRKGRICAGLGW